MLFKIKNGYPEFKQLFKLIGKSFFRNARGPLFLYIVPMFFMILFYYLQGGQNSTAHQKAQMLFGYILIPALTIITSLAPAIVEWKNSVFLKRIDTTGIERSKFLASMYLFYFLVGLSGIIIQFLLALIIGGSNFIDELKNINVGYALLGIVLIILTCISIATLIGGLGNSEGSIQGFVMMIYFLNLFLSGVMMPPETVESSQGVRILSYFVILKYSAFVFLAGFRGGWDFNTSYSDPNQIDFTNIYQPILVAIIIIITLFTITKFTFKWSAKK